MTSNSNKPAKILIVDDDEGIRTGFSQLFSRHGYDTTVAADGNSGLQAYETSRFDLVITDILMPGKDGLTMIKDIRDYDNDAKIIAISGGGRSQNTGFLAIAEDFGATKTLEKPIPNKSLIDTVCDLLGTDETADEWKQGASKVSF